MANQNLIDIWKNLDTFYKNQISNVISTPKNITKITHDNVETRILICVKVKQSMRVSVIITIIF